MIDVVAEDVQFAPDGSVAIDGRDLDGGDDPDALLLAGGDRLGDAADGVVVGQRELLDAGGGRPLDDLGRGQGAV